MEEYIKRMKEDELLKDKRFILWCFFPTKELDDFFHNYLKLYPEDKEIIFSAKNRIRKIKLHSKECEMTEAEFYKAKRNIIDRREKKKERIIFMYLSAACILLFILFYPLYKMNYYDTDKQIILAENEIIDDTQTEIELRLGKNEVIQVPNNTKIKIQKRGSIDLENESVQTIDNIEDADNEENVLKVPYGRRSYITLSDSTKIWVNSGTVLRFPQQFEADKREIFVEGEIFLEVKKDSKRPFYVKTSEMDIRVLGTSFCVTAYPEEDRQVVVLKEGLINVEDKEGNNQKVTPNNMLTLENKEMRVQEVNPSYYISWIDGVLIFKERDLGCILEQLSRYYRISFECSDELKSIKCSGKLVLFDEIDSVMNTLKSTLDISYTKSKDVIIIYTGN